MNKILKDATIDQLINVTEKQWYNTLELLGVCHNVRYEKKPYYNELETGLTISLMNGVSDIHLPQDKVDEAIETVMEYYKSKKLPMHWITGPSTKPENLGESLVRHGLKKGGTSMPGMYLKLNGMKEDYKHPENLEIVKVDDNETLETWSSTLVVGYGFGEEYVEDMTDIYLSFADVEEQVMYVGYLDGKPACTSLVAYNNGVAGLYCVATMPWARRRGLGTLLTLQPLLDAREMGYHYGVLHASNMGEPVYKKMGFETICDFWFYQWSPEST